LCHLGILPRDKLLLLGNFNINLRDPHTEQEEITANIFDNTNVVNFVQICPMSGLMTRIGSTMDLVAAKVQMLGPI
jgi:hypothetical protein